MSLADKTELLRLLQLRERLEAEKPIDTRPSIESFVNDARDQAAAKSPDPCAYIAAWDAHHDALLRISERRARERPRSAELSSAAEFQEVVEMARAEGYPPAWELFPNRAPSPLPPDPIEVARRKSLPRATMCDLEDTRVPHAETAIFNHIVAEQDDENRLLPYRDKSSTTQPPHWPDS
jgi:hypothetical protein